MKTIAFMVGLALLILPNQALAGCSMSSYPHPITGQTVVCITCCSMGADGLPVCQTHCS